MQSIDSWLKSVMGDFYNPVLIDIGKILGISILAFLIIKIGSFAIKKLFEKRKAIKYALNSKKLDTMASLMTSILKYSIYIIAIVIILSDVFEMKSILAAAGIGGVAIGFGAQSLIKDIISGFFIVMEDQFAVGDIITIDGMNGTVEDLELRVTRLRNFSGDLFIIPNGEIKKVTNHTRGNKGVIVDIPLVYGTDINKVFEIAGEVCVKISNTYKTIVEAPKVLGITELGKDTLNLRITAKTLQSEQGEVERAMRKLIAEELLTKDGGVNG
jgi:moderate conductance mechanosensitive channel